MMQYTEKTRNNTLKPLKDVHLASLERVQYIHFLRYFLIDILICHTNVFEFSSFEGISQQILII